MKPTRLSALVRHVNVLSRLLALSVLVAASSTGAPADEISPGVQIVKGAAIAEKIDRSAPSPGGRGGVIAQDEDWRVHASERDAPGLAERHEQDTDVWYVVAGAGTLVTGGTIVDASVTGPGEQRGPAIRGGTSSRSRPVTSSRSAPECRTGSRRWTAASAI